MNPALRKSLPPLITLAVVGVALILGAYAWIYYTRAPWTRTPACAPTW